MKLIERSIFYSVHFGVFLIFAVVYFVLADWIFGILAAFFAVYCIWGIVSNYKEAERRGLMTRAEHRTELRHEAELQSIWESK